MNALVKTLVAVTALALPAVAQTQRTDVRTFAWDPAVIAELQRIPVQDGGRVKPLDTLLQFAMYRIHHKRTMAVPDELAYGVSAGESLRPIEWGLDLLMFPRFANTFPSFTLEDSQALDLVDMGEIQKRRRDRYSYVELEPAIDAIVDKARQILRTTEEKERSLQEGQLVGLANAINEYTGLANILEFARVEFIVPSGPLDDVFGKEVVRSSDLLRSMKGLVAAVSEHGDDEGVQRFLREVNNMVARAHTLAWIPPVQAEGEGAWLTTGALFELAHSGLATDAQIEGVVKWERLVDAVENPAELPAAAAALHDHCVAQVDADVYDKTALEVTYYGWGFFSKALGFFLFGFVLMAIGLLKPTWKWLPRIAFGSTSVALAILTAGITVRCLIRGRPPITGLYDTILFIAAVAVLAGLVIEGINRKRIGLFVASALGAFGMFLSFRHELSSAKDTMPMLVAVLDTNFWLATHVTTVTMGYAAGLLAAALAYVFVISKLFGVAKGDRAYYQELTRMVYGVVGFGLLFSTVGTILGGVWANDSWGRFWGWDPKENGALMIVLWYLMMVHGRLGGYFRQWGMNLMAVLLGAVVAFSWWGVNLLGVGLHSYGFTSGVAAALYLYYGFTGLVFALGVGAWAFERAATRRAEDTAGALPSES